MEQERKNPVERLLADVQAGLGRSGRAEVEPKPGEEMVVVPEITSSATAFYERMRSLLDNKEQHVVRWHTIYRTLGRLMRMYRDDEKIAIELLRELVADGFLPNGAVPVSTESRVRYVLLKYRVLYERFRLGDLFKIAVSEIEVMLYGNQKELFVRALYETARETVVLEDIAQKGPYADACLYLACRKAFLEDDEAGLLYGLWLRHFPEWETQTDIEGENMQDIPSVLHFADQVIADPTHRRLARKLHDLSVYFLVLRVLLEGAGDIGQNKAEREKNIRETVKRLSGAQYGAAREMGWRAFWYILATKTALILPVEYALSRMFFPPVEMVPLWINLFFHPLMLLIMTRTMREPRQVNADMIVFGVERLLSGESLESVRIQTTKPLRVPYVMAYVAVVFGTFFVLAWLLGKAGFTPISIVFFAVLLGIISFFAFRVRTKAGRFTLRRYAEMYPPNFWFSVATIPFIEAGRRLSDGFRAINIFTEVMDFFIEVPFKTFMRVVGVIVPFLEKTVFRVIDIVFIMPVQLFKRMQRSFSSFIKERKEEIG